MATVVLEAKPRKIFGTGSARSDRRSGFVPCVIYGEGKDPEPICISAHQLSSHVAKSTFFSTVFKIEGVSEKGRLFVAKDVQFHPVTERPIHVDFMRVGKGHNITVRVPLTFINEAASPGLKQGGVLNVLVHEIDVVCNPSRIPDHIEVDLTGFEFHHTVHAHDIQLGDGVELGTGGKNFTVATVVAPTILKKEEETPAAEAGTAASEPAASV
ncbi:MAG: 50S ribosomal protein L25/general stress protein Ctc [Holosporaceae bacterium]|jgi:large subunit ribosomal protein L25|nr:50S ribosomal protein L25/general stress protein Ctc [Holosporaceae bacterium]